MCNLITLQIITIGAWRDIDGGWSWNDVHKAGTVTLTQDKFQSLTPRKVFSLLREENALSEYSKGRVALDETFWPQLVVLDKNTGEPLIALEPVNHEDILTAAS